MATNLAIDPQLLDKALEVGGEENGRRRPSTGPYGSSLPGVEQARVLELFGKLDWDDEYDYKRERTRR